MNTGNLTICNNTVASCMFLSLLYLYVDMCKCMFYFCVLYVCEPSGKEVRAALYNQSINQQLVWQAVMYCRVTNPKCLPFDIDYTD